MPTTEHKHHLRVRETQLEIPSSQASAIGEDFEGKVAEAKQQLEYLQSQQQQIERQRVELEELNLRKQEFLHGQVDLTEKFSSAMTTIEREVFEMKQESEDLEQTRQAFQAHLQRIEGLNPDAWPKDQLSDELNRSISLLDQAENEYEQVVKYFSEGRHGSIFGASSRNGTANHSSKAEFTTMIKNGLAFNLPIIITAAIALLIYLFK